MRLIATLVFTLLFVHVYPHGDVHEQIVAVSKLIEADPTNPELYFKRGALYHTHGDFDESFVDYLHALKLKPDFNLVNLRIGELCLKHDFYHTSIYYLNQYIDSIPNNPRAFLTRARSFRMMGDYQSSKKDYAKVNEVNAKPSPEQYFEWAEVVLLDSLGTQEEAINCLSTGQDKIGDLISFREKKIETYIHFKAYEQAIKEVDHLINNQKRNEIWHQHKAEIYLLMGQQNEAMKSFKDALRAIERLPLSRRNTARIIELEKELEESIRNIK